MPQTHGGGLWRVFADRLRTFLDLLDSIFRLSANFPYFFDRFHIAAFCGQVIVLFLKQRLALALRATSPAAAAATFSRPFAAIGLFRSLAALLSWSTFTTRWTLTSFCTFRSFVAFLPFTAILSLFPFSAFRPSASLAPIRSLLPIAAPAATPSSALAAARFRLLATWPLFALAPRLIPPAFLPT